MKVFYHGSPTANIKVLEPKLDPRLGIKGVFVADEPYGPMMFSLLPERANSIVKYKTKDGKFISGKVTTKALNETGWLYTVEADPEIVQERKPGRVHLTATVRVIKSKIIKKEDVLKLGWKIEYLPT